MKNSVVKTILLSLFVSVFLQACQTGCKRNKQQSDNKQEVDVISIRLPIPIVDAAFAPYYIAEDKGFFKKYNLKVTLEPGSTELNPIKMIDQGTDQFGIVGGPEILMTGRTRGARIKAIGLLHVNSNFVTILTKKDSKYQKLSDLKGHEVGFYYGHISTDVLRSLFKKENVNVKEVDIGFNYNLFIADKLPAQWAFTTTAGLTLPEKGIQVHEISPADYGIITQGHTIITNEKLLAENPDLVIRFTSAIIEATKYSIEHVDETIESILKRDKNFSKILALKQLEIYNKTILNNQKILWIDAPILEDTKDRLSLLKLIPEDFDMKNAYDNSFLKEYYTSHK